MDLVMGFTALFVLSDIDRFMSLNISGVDMTNYVKDIKSLDCERYLYIRFQADKKDCKCL